MEERKQVVCRLLHGCSFVDWMALFHREGEWVLHMGHQKAHVILLLLLLVALHHLIAL